MGHCAGGLGANRFGQGDNAPAADPERNIVTALERWVEQGVEPDKIIATGGPDTGFSRPLCPYPQVVRYNGSGNPNEAASFSCAAAQ